MRAQLHSLQNALEMYVNCEKCQSKRALVFLFARRKNLIEINVYYAQENGSAAKLKFYVINN